eukprot:403337967
MQQHQYTSQNQDIDDILRKQQNLTQNFTYTKTNFQTFLSNQANSSLKQDAYGFKLTIQSLINQSAKILSEIQQTKLCIESWCKKHLITLNEMSKKLEELLIELDSKTKMMAVLQGKSDQIQTQLMKQSNSIRINQENEQQISYSLEQLKQQTNQIALKLRIGAIDIFKETMQTQLDQYDMYLEYLFKSIKALPENYSSIVSQQTERRLDFHKYFKLNLVVENALLPYYDKLLIQINEEYLVMVNYEQNFTDILHFSPAGFRHVNRIRKSFTVAHQHLDKLFLGNDVFLISNNFQFIQSIGYGEEISAYCTYDRKILLVGQNNYKIGVYRAQSDGTYQEFKQIRTQPQFTFSQIVSIFKLTERLFLVILGKPKISIRVVEIDPVRWQQIEAQKIGCYSGSIQDIQRVSETKFLAQTSKKIIMFDYTVEGYEKLIRFKESSNPMDQNINSNLSICNEKSQFSNPSFSSSIENQQNKRQHYLEYMIVFPFFDPWDIPYILGDQLKIYDLKSRQQIGILEGIENPEDLNCLGFIKNTTFLVISNKINNSLQLLNLELIN